jgi:hypothetical protein
MVKKYDLKVFALIWSGIFLLIGVFPILKEGEVRIWSIVTSVIFGFIALVRPELLTKFYNIWMKVGEFIGGIVSKIILFILFFGLFTPISIFLKVIGKDLLHKKLDKSQESYWTNREIQPQSMKNQF